MNAKTPSFPYVEVVVRPDEAAPLGARLLSLGASGLEERDAETLSRAPAGRVVLVAYFASAAAARVARATLGQGRAGRLRGDDWADAWKAFAKTRRFGRLVVAPHHRALRTRRGDRVVRLDPGRAFGTGSHPSTSLCLARLAARLRPTDRVLDVGTGSGVLAIAAARLGARKVVAVDNDPEAVATAIENVVANGLGGAVGVWCGTAADVRGRFDVVVANLTAPTLAESAADLRARLAPSGLLVVSGILSGQVRDVRRAFAPLEGEVHARGEWRALTFRAPRAKGRRR